MKEDLITIQEAAEISNKSVQTIRRAIKNKKLKASRQKTPQGFSYLTSQSAVCALYKIKSPTTQTQEQTSSTSRSTKQKKVSKEKTETAIAKNDMAEFNKTLQELIREHSQERQNYLRLIQVMQEKMMALENRLNLLQASNQKSWFQFWK